MIEILHDPIRTTLPEFQSWIDIINNRSLHGFKTRCAKQTAGTVASSLAGPGVRNLPRSAELGMGVSIPAYRKESGHRGKAYS